MSTSETVFPQNTTLYYIPGKSGWTTPLWKGYHTAPWDGNKDTTPTIALTETDDNYALSVELPEYAKSVQVFYTLYDANGDAHVVKEVNPDYDGYEDTVFCGELHGLNGIPISRMARDLTHKLPDSWEAIAEDAGGEIAERIRALAAGGGD